MKRFKYCLVAYIFYVVLLSFLFGVRYGGVFLHFWKVDLPDARILVIESDDYGAPSASLGIVNKVIVKWSTQRGSKPAEYTGQMKWLQNTALTPDDLERLYEVLERHIGALGRHPAFTANLILSEPDFSRIKEGGFKNYFYIAHDKSEPIVQKWREGIRRGVFYPQLHGREHFAYRRWLRVLRDGNPVALRLFNENLVSLPLAGVPRYPWVFAPGPVEEIGPSYTTSTALKIRDAVAIFTRIMGYSPKSVIAPYYGWSEIAEQEWAKWRIIYIQGANYRWTAFDQKGKKRFHPHYLGEMNRFGQLYLVRNSEFEPFKGKGYCAEACLKRIRHAFLLGLPAVVFTHRGNYSSLGLDDAFPGKGFGELDKLLSEVEKNFPDVCYLTTPELGELIATGSYHPVFGRSRTETLPRQRGIKKFCFCLLRAIASKPFGMAYKIIYLGLFAILVLGLFYLVYLHVYWKRGVMKNTHGPH